MEKSVDEKLINENFSSTNDSVSSDEFDFDAFEEASWFSRLTFYWSYRIIRVED